MASSMKKHYTVEERILIERARWWLSQYRWLQLDIKTLEDTLAALRSAYDRIASSISSTIPAAGTVSDRTANAAEAVVSAEETLLLKVAKKAAILIAIEKAIDRIDCDRYRVMLKRHFLCGMKWEDVADSTGYSASDVYRHVNDALLATALFLPKNYKDDSE